MRFKLKAYSISECGQRVDAEGHPHQEDSLYPAHGCLKDSDRLFIVCDGMGGHDAGEVASATVCEAMSRAVMEQTPDPEGPFSDAVLEYALDKAYRALDDRDSGAARKMGTTLTFLKLHEDGCTIAHMGDSRVYHIRPGKDAASTEILFRTEDHSLINDLIKVGELTPEEARSSLQKNVITRALQPHMEPRCKASVYHTSDIRPGDYFYLCTDGMLENSEDSHIRFNFSDQTGRDESKIKTLVKVTEKNRDNHSAIVVHILNVKGKAVHAFPAPKVANARPESIMAELSSAPSGCSGSEHRSRKRIRRFVWGLLLAVLLGAGAYAVYCLQKGGEQRDVPGAVTRPSQEQVNRKE